MENTRAIHRIDELTIAENAKGNTDLLGFSLRLNDLIEENGISQDELAATTGLSEAAIHKYRSGKTEPKLSNLRKIAEALKVDCSYLITGTSAKYANFTELGLNDSAIEKLKCLPDLLMLPLKQITCDFINSSYFKTLMMSLYFLCYDCEEAADIVKEVRTAIDTAKKGTAAFEDMPVAETTNSINVDIGKLSRNNHTINAHAFELTEAILNIAEELSGYRNIKDQTSTLFDEIQLFINDAQLVKHTIYDDRGNPTYKD